jgi:tetratricopeptide (TPR) repeat protein
VDVLPTSAVLDLPLDLSPAEIAARLGIRFLVHGAIQSSKGQWHLSLEMFDTQLQAPCLTRKCELDMNRLSDIESDIARQIASALNRPLGPVLVQQRPRYSRDPLAYAEFMRGYRLSATGDPATMEQSISYLTNAVTRDPSFALAHATLSFACTTLHYQYDPASMWLEKAEFHCRRALEIDSELAEGHMARAFLLWGPSRNFQHLEAIAGLKRALALQSNLPHAYNRLGSILAHIGLLDHAREMFERGR